MSLSAALGLWRTRAGSSRTSAGLGRRTHNPVRWAPVCSTPAGWCVHLWDPNTEEWQLVQASHKPLYEWKTKRRKNPNINSMLYCTCWKSVDSEEVLSRGSLKHISGLLKVMDTCSSPTWYSCLYKRTCILLCELFFSYECCNKPQQWICTDKPQDQRGILVTTCCKCVCQ